MLDPELIVVGAGALGAATAWEAAEAGADVLVLERGAPCSGTSPLGAGLVSRLIWRPDEIGLVDRSVDAFRRLDSVIGDRFTYHETGSVTVVGPEHEREAERLLRVWRAHGIDVEPVETGRLDDVPGLAGLELTADETALVTDADGWAVTTDAVGAMLDRVEDAGGEIQAHTPVERVDDGGVHLEDGDRRRAGAVVVAAGVWTPELFDHGWRPPILAYRAQAAALQHGQPSTPGPCVHDVPNHTYWRPEGPGKLVAGDGTDLSEHATDREPTTDGRFAAELKGRVVDRWPGAGEAKLVRDWAGLAASTPDARPLVGAVPGLETVYLCAGANGFGFMRAPALGEAAAHAALDRDPPVAPTGMRPERFEDPPASFEMEEGFAP